MLVDIGRSGAEFSHNRVYRYTLWREWDESKGTIAFIGLNPSTADESKNDPTVRLCINHAKSWGYGKMYMLNIFAFRATDPTVMKAAVDPVGPDNIDMILETVDKSDMVLGCWGAHGSHLEQGKKIFEVLDSKCISIHCFGVTKGGHPRHPLYMKKVLKPLLYEGSSR